jgi:hypothetical protein
MYSDDSGQVVQRDPDPSNGFFDQDSTTNR